MYSKYIKNIKNEYRVLGTLGTTGRTLLIEQIKSFKQYVAKLNDEIKTDKDQEAFLNEITFGVNEQYPELMHINALNFKDFNDENHPTIITNFMEKGSLENNFHILEKKQKYIILLSIANCLNFLHKNKVMHLNLHPNNILLDPQYYPRITDYYGYKTHKLSEKIDNKIGLSLYIAPEVISDKKFGPKADVYSYGIIAFEIITNDRSFTDIAKKYENFDDIPKNILPNLLLIKNENLRNIIMKCLSTDPKDRPSFDEILESLGDDLIKDDMGVETRDIESYYNFQCLEKATKGDPDAMNRIGCMRDYAKAKLDQILFFYDGAIEKGNNKAMFNKSSMLYFGRNCEKNIDEALELMKMAIENHNSYAMLNFGCMNFYGVHVPRDTEEGLYYLKAAVKNKNPHAMKELGEIYLFGYSVPKNVTKGIQLLEQAADMKVVSALITLAKTYRDGDDVPKNIDEAIRLLKRAIKIYSNEAKCVLADIYAYEDSVKNEKEALRLLDEAIKDNCPEADYRKQNLLNHKRSPYLDSNFIYVTYVDFFDGLNIDKPKRHHIACLKKSDFQQG